MSHALLLNCVRRSGDVMTGDLNIGLNRLFLTDGVDGTVIKGQSAGGNMLYVRNYADTARGSINLALANLNNNLTIAAGMTVDGIDVSEIDQAKIITGTYTGNGVDDRNINIGVDLTAKNNVYVIIKNLLSAQGTHRTEYSQGDLSMYFGAAGDIANMIQAFNSTGFQIGTNTTVNNNTQTYRYIVIYEEP